MTSPLPLPPLSKGGDTAAPEGFLPVADCFPLTTQCGPGMPGPHASVSPSANLKQHPTPTTPATSTFRPCGNLPRPKNAPQGRFCPAVRWTRGPGFSIPTRVTFYARHLLKSAYKEKSSTSCEVELFGDPCGNRTHVNGVRGRCLNRLTNGP